MALWCSLQVLQESRVPKKPMDTCDNILEINIKCLTINYFSAFEWWTTRQLLINDVVELLSIGVREAK
ncbi:hypothetical protein L208DRAFT_1494360, partial [Tricholoma matsutake]